MVNGAIVKRLRKGGKTEKTETQRGNGITSFTTNQTRERNIACARFPISSRSAGVPRSQKTNKNRVILQKRKAIKQQLWLNFTWYSQNVKKNSGDIRKKNLQPRILLGN
jgi:hypothetical protein